jgi:hypothetical protein
VFVSYRVAEADTEARLLKARLWAEQGVPAFVSSLDIERGDDWRRVVARNLKTAQ